MKTNLFVVEICIYCFRVVLPYYRTHLGRPSDCYLWFQGSSDRIDVPTLVVQVGGAAKDYQAIGLSTFTVTLTDGDAPERSGSLFEAPVGNLEDSVTMLTQAICNQCFYGEISLV